MRWRALSAAMAAAAPVALLLAASAGGAQTIEPSVAGRAGIEQVFARIGQCMADTQPSAVRTWLSLLPGSEAEDRFVRKQEGALTVCMESGRVRTKGRLAYQPGELRPFIVAAAARRSAEKAPAVLPVPASTPPWFSTALAALGEGAVFDRRALVQQDFGHCLVLASWAASRSLILAREGSKEEQAAVAALTPSLGPCVTAGAEVKLTRGNIRRAISEPFYHLAVQPPGGRAGGEA